MKEWSEFNDGADGHISERLVELADVQSGSRVLDVAAGYGEPALTAACKAVRWVGLDQSYLSRARLLFAGRMNWAGLQGFITRFTSLCTSLTSALPSSLSTNVPIKSRFNWIAEAK